MRPARFRWAVGALLGLTLLGSGGWFVSMTPVFHVRTLVVVGNHHLSDAQVIRLAGMSGTSNVLWLRTGMVARRIERDPWVRRAQVSRSLSGTVTVTVEERRAVAVAETAGTLLLVSADGTILSRARPRVRLPRIAVPAVGQTPGGRIPGSPALVVARSLPPALRAEVDRITATGSARSLTVILRDGVHALFGNASEAMAKARALSSVLAWARKQGVRVGSIDVRAPAAPALLPA